MVLSPLHDSHRVAGAQVVVGYWWCPDQTKHASRAMHLDLRSSVQRCNTQTSSRFQYRLDFGAILYACIIATTGLCSRDQPAYL